MLSRIKKIAPVLGVFSPNCTNATALFNIICQLCTKRVFKNPVPSRFSKTHKSRDMKQFLLTLTAACTLAFGSFAQNPDVGVSAVALLDFTTSTGILPGADYHIGDTIFVGGAMTNYGDTIMAGDSIPMLLTATGFTDIPFKVAFTSNLDSGATDVWSSGIILLTVGVPTGDFEICAESMLAGDTDPSNDGACQTINMIVAPPPAGIAERTIVENLYYSNNALRFQLGSQQQSQLTLVDVSGKVVMQETLAAHSQELQLGNIPNGIYVVRIQSGTDVVVRKIAKF